MQPTWSWKKGGKGASVSKDGSLVPIHTLDGSQYLLRVTPDTTCSAAAAAVKAQVGLPAEVTVQLHVVEDNGLKATAPEATIASKLLLWTEDGFKGGSNGFVLKRIGFVPDAAKAAGIEEPTAEPASVQFAFGEAVYHFLRGEYRFVKDTVVVLGGLLLQARRGNHNEARDAPAELETVLPSIVPRYAYSRDGEPGRRELASFPDALSAPALCEALAERHKAESGSDVKDVQCRFLRICRQAVGYGGVFVFGKHTWKDRMEEVPAGEVKSRTEDVQVVVWSTGISMLALHDPMTNEVHPFEIITKWTTSSDSQIFAFSDEDDKIVYLMTERASDLEAAVESYVAEIVAMHEGGARAPLPVVGDVPTVSAVIPPESLTEAGAAAAAGAAGALRVPPKAPPRAPSTPSPRAMAATEEDGPTPTPPPLVASPPRTAPTTPSSKPESAAGGGEDGDSAAAGEEVTATEGDAAGEEVMATEGDAAGEAGTATDSPTPAAEEAAPQSDWYEVTDDDGDVFYVNRKTSESTWEKPAGLAAKPAAAAEEAPKDPAPPTESDDVAALLNAREGDSDLPLGWEAHEDEEGDTFYVNKVTGAAAWEKPTEAAVGFKGDVGELPEGWEAHEDEDGDTFFVNSITGESTWDKPTEPAK